MFRRICPTIIVLRKCVLKKQELGCQREEAQQRDQPRRFLLALELPLEAHRVALRQTDSGDGGLYVRHSRAQITSGDIKGQLEGGVLESPGMAGKRLSSVEPGDAQIKSGRRNRRYGRGARARFPAMGGPTSLLETQIPVPRAYSPAGCSARPLSSEVLCRVPFLDGNQSRGLQYALT